METDKKIIVNANKRKRSVNWDSLEKDLLHNCTKQFVDLIENKKTDTNTNKAKASAWLKICRMFNVVNSRHRTLVEIKQQWRCTKLHAKKEFPNYRREQNGTGGGEKPPSPDHVTNEILQMIPLEFEVDTNKFDSDGIILPVEEEKKVVEKTVYSPKHVENDKDIIATPSTSKPNEKPQNYLPRKKKMLFEQSDFLKKRNETLINSIETEHNLKIKQTIEAHEWAKEEHELRLKESKLRIKKLELENELLFIRLNAKDF